MALILDHTQHIYNIALVPARSHLPAKRLIESATHLGNDALVVCARTNPARCETHTGSMP